MEMSIDKQKKVVAEFLIAEYELFNHPSMVGKTVDIEKGKLLGYGIREGSFDGILKGLKKEGCIVDFYSPLGKSEEFIKNILDAIGIKKQLISELKKSKHKNKDEMVVRQERALSNIKELLNIPDKLDYLFNGFNGNYQKELLSNNYIILIDEGNLANLKRIASINPFEVIKDDETNYSVKIYKRVLTFKKNSLDYFLIKYMVENYDNNNTFYHNNAIDYITQNKPRWSQKISSVIENINYRNIKGGAIIRIIKKGKTFGFTKDILLP